MRKYAKSLADAKRLFRGKTGVDYGSADALHTNGIYIFKTGKPVRQYFVGTRVEFDNAF